MDLRGDVESLSEISYSVVEENGEITVLGSGRSDFSKSGSDEFVRFNTNGDVIERFVVIDGEVMLWNFYKYDNNLLQSAEVYFAEISDSIPEYVTNFTYNENGKPFTMTTLQRDSVVFMFKEFGYDAKGEVYDEVVFDANGERLGRTFFTYNKKGEVTESRICGPSGELLERRVQAYNSKGELKRLEVYDQDNVLLETTEFNYDKNGNITKDAYESNDGFKSVVKYSYNHHGFVDKIIYQSSIFEKPLEVTYEYQYDNANNWIESIERQDGEMIYVTKREISYF